MTAEELKSKEESGMWYEPCNTEGNLIWNRVSESCTIKVKACENPSAVSCDSSILPSKERHEWMKGKRKRREEASRRKEERRLLQLTNNVVWEKQTTFHYEPLESLRDVGKYVKSVIVCFSNIQSNSEETNKYSYFNQF